MLANQVSFANIVFILLWTTCEGENPGTGSTVPPERSRCDINPCYNNGLCTATNATAGFSCHCHRLFIGALCEKVNMKIPGYLVDTHSITFTWPEAIDLGPFRCLYIKTPDIVWFWEDPESLEWIKNELDDLHRIQIPPGNRTSLVVRGLKGDATKYTLCLIHERLLPNVTDPSEVRIALSLENPNCGSLQTSYGGEIYSKVARYVALAMGLSIIALVIIKAIVDCQDTNKRALIRNDIKKSFKLLKRPTFKRRQQRTNDNNFERGIGNDIN